jgi:hypothetical protein
VGLHPRRAVGHHEEAHPALALDDDRVARVEAALFGGVRDGLELTIGKPFEQRHLSQCLEAFVGHACTSFRRRWNVPYPAYYPESGRVRQADGILHRPGEVSELA